MLGTVLYEKKDREWKMYCNSNVDDAANCGNDGVCITYIYIDLNLLLVLHVIGKLYLILSFRPGLMKGWAQTKKLCRSIIYLPEISRWCTFQLL